MKNKTVFSCIVGFVFGCASIADSLQAGTVALWKLDYEANGSALNARCLLNPANDLGLNGTFWSGTSVDGWTKLPPNPDATGNLLASPTNLNAVGLSANATVPYTSLTNCAVSARVNVTNSFTIEGWMNRIGNPAGTGWHYLVGNHMGGAGRWILSLRQGGTNWILYVDGRINDVAFPVKNDPASTNVWRHLALTYNRDAGSAQQGVWELFVDSQSYGALTNSSRPATVATADSVFSLGGRPSSLNTSACRLDYWRVSDAVLTTNEFLNAGIAVPEAETLPRTLAYFRLDGDASGIMQTSDSVGGAALFGNMDTSYVTVIKPATNHAFAGQPPNSAVALPAGNSGSAYAQASGACLRTPTLGTQLEVTNSFTVEGWLCPHRSDYNASVQYIANTRVDFKGWAFALKQFGAALKLVVFAEDTAGILLFDVPVSGDLSAWSDTWKHVALVYDATAGALAQGVWTCYLDGLQQGCVTNTRAVSGDSGSSYFHLAGRVDVASSFSGYLDCWRVSRTALAPNQFLSATNGAAAATDVLALWPLNSADNVYLDATDLVGAYSFNAPATSTYKVTANTDQAATNIPNPDATAAFKGNPAANTGSVFFNTPTETASKAYLSTTDGALRALLCYTNSFTWEGWFFRTKNPGSWQLLFATGAAPNATAGGMSINLSYRTNGYVLYANDGTMQVNDILFPGTTDDKTLNVWRHLALVYDAAVTNGIWTLYVDGLSQGTLTNLYAQRRSTAECIYVGGRPWSANSFYGAIDAVRLTKGALAPNQFLNAAVTPPAPPSPKTVAYWKLDSAGTALDASSQVEPRYSFIADAYAPTGTTAQFKRFVPTPDTTEGFIGDPKANAGSAAFSSDYLRIQNLGYRVELDRPFTVEGWMLWSNQTSVAVQTIAGTRFTADYGWRLTLNKNGAAAAFRIFCQAPSQTPVLDADFAYDAAGLAGGWHHLALAYTPRRNDTGTWELFVDGESVGTAINLFYPTALQQSHWFMLGGCAGGADAFDGLLDCWRVTEGALTPEQFLYLGYELGTLLKLH